jgi:prepilin-type processing-associated H-X9-DG protein
MKAHLEGVNARKHRLGFTLVELVVLVVAVVVLVGLLIPAITVCDGRTPSRRAKCLNNVKQIGLALRLYSGDNQERFPCDAGATTLGSFALLTNNYQTSYKTWVCLSDTNIVAGLITSTWTKRNLSYAYGGFGLTEGAQPDTPLVCDRSSSGNPTGVNPWDNNTWTHKSDGGNVLYVDGHVAWTKTMIPPMYRGKNP